MFSVIIPLYNKAAYIEKAIKSVLSQSFQEFELIVVDDGSTDDSFEKLRVLSSESGVGESFEFGVLSSEFGDQSVELGVLSYESNSTTSGKRIRVFQQENQGVSTARNNGVKLAKYETIAFLDADDWWEPTYLEEMKVLIAEFPEAGIYGCSYYKVKNEQLIRANIGVEKDFNKGLINYCQVYAKTLYMPLWTGATIIKKEVFELEHGFKPNLKLGEDFDLWVRVAMNYPVVFLNKPLAYYNQDVELSGRAIGEKLYMPKEHMLFTDYGELNKNLDFRFLFERLAIYGLLPYYLAGKNKRETDEILSGINWKQQALKNRLYYRILPKYMVRFWFYLLKKASQIKNRI